MAQPLLTGLLLVGRNSVSGICKLNLKTQFLFLKTRFFPAPLKTFSVNIS